MPKTMNLNQDIKWYRMIIQCAQIKYRMLAYYYVKMSKMHNIHTSVTCVFLARIKTAQLKYGSWKKGMIISA